PRPPPPPKWHSPCSCPSAPFSGFSGPILRAPRPVDLTGGPTPPPSLGRYFGTSIVAMPSTRPGSRAASKMITPAPTTATVAAVATNSSWLSANSSKPSAGSFASLSAILPPFAASDLCRSMEFLSSALVDGQPRLEPQSSRVPCFAVDPSRAPAPHLMIGQDCDPLNTLI